MVRKPPGFTPYKPPKFGAQVGRPKAYKEPKIPTRRKRDFEDLLCEAIRRQVKVAMRYDDDTMEREIAPYVVFESEDEEVCVSTFQFYNPAKPQDGNEPRTFTVGKIETLRITGETFAIDPRFERGSKRHYRILCSI